MRALLDINVLIALLDTEHIHHRKAAHWLEENIDTGWASCPVVQNGVIRIMSQPAYPNPRLPASVAGRLRAATNTRWHQFWPDGVSLLEPDNVAWDRILGSRQITDVYLLVLAIRNNGRLISFDRKIEIATVPGAESSHLVVLD